MSLPPCCTYISMNGYVLGWYRQNVSAGPLRTAKVSVGTWYGGSYIRKQGRKNKSLGWEIQSVGVVGKEIEIKGRGRHRGKDMMKTSLQRKIKSKKENSLYISLKCPLHTGNDLFLMNWITCFCLMMLSLKLFMLLCLEVKCYQWRMINDC